MTEELTPAELWLHAHGYPPIAGGAEDEDANDESDQQDAPEDTPQPDTPEGDEESFTDSYNPDDLPDEARAAYDAAYKKMQADYTRKTQSLSEQRQEAEQAVALVEALRDPSQRDIALALIGGEDADDDDQEGPSDEELTEVDRLERVEQALENMAEQEKLAELEELEDEYLEQEFQTLSEKHGREFTDEEAELLYVTATHPAFRDSRGMPDVNAAYERLAGLEKGAVDRTVSSKKKAPKPGPGSPGSKTVDLSDDEARLQATADIIDSHQED